MKYILLSLAILFMACRNDSGTTYTTLPSHSCSVTQNSNGVVITCPDGSSATLLNGVNGTQITMVQFCSGQTTNYPTSFPEYGICIDKLLYGVYWDKKNAWLAQIASGTYLSTSTGLQCNFKVLNGCEIQ